MKRLLFSAYLGFIVYIASFALLGPASPGSMERLNSEKIRIQSNLADLERLNYQLKGRMIALESDPEAQSLEARSLGYLDSGEVHIRVSSYKNASRYAVAGKILTLREASTTGQSMPLIIAAIVSGFVFVFSLSIKEKSPR